MCVSKVLFGVSLFVALANADSISLIAKYKDSCEKLDIDSFLKNPALVNSYVHCLLNKGTCTKYGKEIKSIIPEILSTTCADCSTTQKRIVQRVMNFMYSNKRPEFDALFDLYDPQKLYRASMMNFMTHADYASDSHAPSNGTLHKSASRHSPRPILSTTHGSSTTDPSTVVVTQRKVHTRSPRISQTTSTKHATDAHRTHRTHTAKFTGNSSTEPSQLPPALLPL